MGVDILARVAWCRPQGPNDYLVGVQFLDLDGNSRDVLKKFLIDFRLYQSDKPLNY